MANAKTIVKRRKAVTNIEKITRTMQLIATAKFQKAMNRATATQPYTEKLTELVTHLSRQVTDVDHPLLRSEPVSGRSAVLVLTSNRGFCGGYNGRLLDAGLNHLRESEKNLDIELDVSGKKGIKYYRFLGREIRKSYTHLEDKVRFDQVEMLADEFIDRFARRELDSVYVVYMKFQSVARQVPTVIELLPMQAQADADESAGDSAGGEAGVQYDFSPDPEALLAELLPAAVRTRLFQCFTDAAVSEQIARMVAMKAATDAAKDMIKILTRTYNRARQTQITMELLDIIGGVEAIS
jgi:F-type H+-transporting ATPase subunit gamma